MALWQRRPTGVIHHSDQGSQYTSLAFGKRCEQAGVRPSMGSVGDCFDNALCETFFATLECELLNRKSFKTQAEARTAVFEFIEALELTRFRRGCLGKTEKDGTIHIVATPLSITSHRATMKGGTPQHRSTNINLPRRRRWRREK